MRYLALATAIVGVVLAVVIVLGHGGTRSDPRVRYSSRVATPGPAQNDSSRGAVAAPVTGDAPWALSALPECFRELARARGSLPFVRAHVPPGARLVPSGTSVIVADCRLEVAARGIAVIRGENVLRIPAPAKLSLSGATIVLETRVGERGEVRTYRLAAGTALRLARKRRVGSRRSSQRR